jgi:hypothetical protein
MEYWVLLTEGPLPFPDPTADAQGEGAESGRPQSGAKGAKASARKSKEEDGNESTYTHVLRDIDHAMEANVSMKDARRRKFQNQVFTIKRIAFPASHSLLSRSTRRCRRSTLWRS